MKKLNEKTFDYFRKYTDKAKEVNAILNSVKESLKYENLEQEIEENSIFPYLFKIDKIKNIGNKTMESQTSEIYSGYNVPTIVNHTTKKVHRKKIKIEFEEILNEEKSPSEEIKKVFKEMFEVRKEEPFDFEFLIKGYYIYNIETETVEKIEVDKEIKFYNTLTTSKRILEIEGFDETDDGKTYEEIKSELFSFLNKIKKTKEINKEEFSRLIDEIAYSEREKVCKEVVSYVIQNVNILDVVEENRTRVYTSDEDITRAIREFFD